MAAAAASPDHSILPPMVPPIGQAQPQNLPPVANNVNSVAFSALHPEKNAVEFSSLTDHNATNITAEIGEGLKEYNSLDELKKANVERQKTGSWLSRNWGKLLLGALAIAIVAIAIFACPPVGLAGLGGLAVAFKLMGFGFCCFLAPTLGLLAVTQQEPSTDPKLALQMHHLNKYAPEYHSHVTERLSHYKPDPNLPADKIKSTAEWANWEINPDVFDVMHNEELEKEKKRYQELVEGQDKQDALRRINRLREDLDQKELNYVRQMGLVPKEGDLLAGMHYRNETDPPYTPTRRPLARP